MTKLDGLYRVTAKGRVYWYAWRGGPRIKAAPETPEFAAEYAMHHAERKGGDKTRLSGLIVDWKLSDAWSLPPEQGGLAASTRRDWLRCLSDIQMEFGKIRLSAFDLLKPTRVRIRNWRDRWAATPREADRHVQVLSALLAFGVKRGRLNHNACTEIEFLYASNRAEIIWTPEDVAAFTAATDKWGRATPPELVWALKLATLTGLRQADLLSLTWGQIGDLAIERKTNKSRVRGSAQRTALVPMYAELRDLLKTIPRRGPMVLTNTDGQPWRSFRSSWNDAMDRAGLKGRLRFHDTRGTFATRLYLAGFTLAEIAEAMAWSPERVGRIINRYVLKGSLLQDRIRRLDEARKS